MVKLDGSGQNFTAECFGISQSTVSRIVRRYERWEAHAAAREDGRLDPAERLRSQRWLAFERNEAMLASCLRLAGEMERCKELSKSVTRHPRSYPSAETEVRNESWVLDRVGMAARFLRLAFRINMEQVKLAGAEPAPLPEPLTEEELAEQEAQAEEERAEIAAVRERSNQNIEATQRSIMDELEVARYQAEQARRDAAAAREEAAAARQEAEAARREADEARLLAPGHWPLSPGSQEPGAGSEDVALVLHKMHNLHTPGDENSGASAEPAGVYAAKATDEENLEICMHNQQGGSDPRSG